MSTTNNRYSRQKDIVSNRIHEISPIIIGVGAIGRNLSLQLASIGVQKMTLIDFDTIEEPNICTQGYLEEDLGNDKVSATRDMIQKINGSAEVIINKRRFNRQVDKSNIILCCVDKMSTRKFIWESQKPELYIDSRMAAETMRILTVDSEESREYYPTTLFRDEEAVQLSCTAKATIYCANIAAALMVSSLTKWLRDVPNDRDIQINLLSNEIIVR